MTQNIESLNGIEDIENIISSPSNNVNKELSIDEECKFGKVDKEIDSFGDISGIKNENNENLNDMSLLIINKNISRSNLLRNKVVPKLVNIYNTVFDNYKRTELTYTTKKNVNASIPKFNNNKYEFLNYKTINNIGNIFSLQNIRSDKNNDKKYNLLFEENKELDINSLREYFKFKKDNLNSNYDSKNQNLNKNKPKKYINIFNDTTNGKNSKKLYNSLNINFDNFKLNKRQNKFINFYAQKDYQDIYKSNNNSKKNINKEKIKFKLFGNELTKNKTSYSFLSINNHNDKNDFFLNSLRDLNKSKNLKKQDSSWLTINNKNRIQNNTKMNQNDKIIDKYKSKNALNTSPILTEFDYNNKNNSKNNNHDFKLIPSKLYLKDYSKNNNQIKNKILQIDRNNRINNEFHFSMNEEKENNSNLSNLKNKKISFNKLTENNNFSEKLNGNYENIFNLLDNKISLMLNNKIKKTRFNEFNSRYKSKLNYFKINPKLLSFSQNDSIKNNLIEQFKENNKINYKIENDFKFPSRNKLRIQITEDISPFKKAINKDLNFDIFHSNNYEHEFTNKKNKAKNLLNLL